MQRDYSCVMHACMVFSLALLMNLFHCPLMCILALLQEYGFKIVLFLHCNIPSAEEAVLFLIEFAVSFTAIFRSERRERNLTLKCCIHVWEHFHDNRIGGSIYCTRFIEMESKDFFFLGHHRINTLAYLL